MHSSELFKLFKLTQPCNFRKMHGFILEPQYAGLHIAVGPAVIVEPGSSKECGVSSPVSLRRLRMTCCVQLMNCLYIEWSFTLLWSNNCKHIYARRMKPGRWLTSNYIYIQRLHEEMAHRSTGCVLTRIEFNKLLE